MEKKNRMIKFIGSMDERSLWWLGILEFLVAFAPFLLWGENSVFPIHDQLDETLLSYVFAARHGLGAACYPEMMGGIAPEGIQPSAVLFVLLYRLFPVYAAFVIQYGIVFLTAFFGMYFCVKDLTESSILAVITAGLFCMLPFMPVYGLSVMGVPAALWAFRRLWNRRGCVLPYLVLLFFGLTTHLVLMGYVILGAAGVLYLYSLVKRKPRWSYLTGMALLTLVYVLVNRSLFVQLVLGKSDFVSHRVEMVNYGQPFWNSVKEMLLYSGQHVESLHIYLIPVIGMALLLGAVLYGRLSAEGRKYYKLAWAGCAVLVGIALFYGFCKSAPVVEWKNSRTGFFRYFQAERLYWLYGSGWFLETAVCAGVFQSIIREKREDGRRALYLAGQTVLLLLLMVPTIQLIKTHSYFYMNINQHNNGSSITGYVSWKSFYAEDVMKQIEETIGRDKSEYRIAHLGISPAPALMHGFYTVDGYSNNYALDYKHRVRRVIEKELARAPQTAAYFDDWGSRCYLFTSETGTNWMLGKDREIVYRNPELDTVALKELGCEYLFSCGIIENADELGLECLGYFSSEDSYWGIWLYKL